MQSKIYLPLFKYINFTILKTDAHAFVYLSIGHI